MTAPVDEMYHALSPENIDVAAPYHCLFIVSTKKKGKMENVPSQDRTLVTKTKKRKKKPIVPPNSKLPFAQSRYSTIG